MDAMKIEFIQDLKVLGRVLQAGLVVCALLVLARLLGRPSIDAFGTTGFATELAPFALAVASAAHYWSGLNVYRNYEDLRIEVERDARQSGDDPTPLLHDLLDELRPQVAEAGLAFRGTEQRGRRNGVAVATRRDRHMRRSLAMLAFALAAFLPWTVEEGSFTLTVSPTRAMISAAAVFAMCAVNWAVGSVWVGLVSEIRLDRNVRTIPEHKAGLASDPSGWEPGCLLITVGIPLLVMSIAFVAGGIVTTRTESTPLGMLAAAVVVVSPAVLLLVIGVLGAAREWFRGKGTG
jgi:hypothetical protein